MNRKQIYDSLMRAEDEARADHVEIANAVMAGKTLAEICDTTEIDKWPDTYFWLKNEMRLIAAAATMGRKGGAVKSEAKTTAARENAKKGGRPPLCAECKERCEPGLSPVWMKHRKRDGLWHAIEVPLCIDHRHVGTVRYKGRYCTSAN